MSIKNFKLFLESKNDDIEFHHDNYGKVIDVMKENGEIEEFNVTAKKATIHLKDPVFGMKIGEMMKFVEDIIQLLPEYEMIDKMKNDEDFIYIELVNKNN